MAGSALRPSPRAAAAVDTVALLAFVVVGVIQHEGFELRGVLRTGIPLLVAWFLVALVVGTYRQPSWARMLATWVVAVPLGLVARSAVRGGPWGKGLLVFGGVAMAFTLLFLLGGRLLLLGLAHVRRRRAEAVSA